MKIFYRDQWDIQDKSKRFLIFIFPFIPKYLSVDILLHKIMFRFETVSELEKCLLIPHNLLEAGIYLHS